VAGDAHGIVPARLDHVAIRVVDRDAYAGLLAERLDVGVLDRSDHATLVGADGAHGALLLREVPPGVQPISSRIVSLVLAEASGVDVPPPIVVPGGPVLTFTSLDELGEAWDGTPRHAVVGLSLRAHDPALAAAELEGRFGMGVATVGPDHAVLDVGGRDGTGRITYTRERWDEDSDAVLEHVGVRVGDLDEWLVAARRASIEAEPRDDAAVPSERSVHALGPERLPLVFAARR
jgi:hypothetical protein